MVFEADRDNVKCTIKALAIGMNRRFDAKILLLIW